jgi:hypothetical protein
MEQAEIPGRNLPQGGHEFQLLEGRKHRYLPVHRSRFQREEVVEAIDSARLED